MTFLHATNYPNYVSVLQPITIDFDLYLTTFTLQDFETKEGTIS